MRLPKFDANGVTLPAWALSLLLAFLAWGVSSEVRARRLEDRVELLAGQLSEARADHERLVVIEARAAALLELQEATLRLLRTTTVVGPGVPE